MCGGKAVVIKGIASLKPMPQQDIELADEVLFGMAVEILEEVQAWFYVETAYHYKGYMKKEDVLLQNNSWEGLEKGTVIASFADILGSPKYSSGCMMALPRGSVLTLSGAKQDKWVEVILPKGEKGWIREDALLKPLQGINREKRYSIVETALMYLGTQYRWGGKTPMGIDCSGLSSMAYLLNEIIIPRDSDEQMSFMKKISRRESKPGDLLFFPGHVAVYIGEDKFVHATGMDAVVKINSLNKDSKLYRKDLDEKYICTGTVF